MASSLAVRAGAGVWRIQGPFLSAEQTDVMIADGAATHKRWVPIGKGSVKVMPSLPPHPSSTKRREHQMCYRVKEDIPAS